MEDWTDRLETAQADLQSTLNLLDNLTNGTQPPLDPTRAELVAVVVGRAACALADTLREFADYYGFDQDTWPVVELTKVAARRVAALAPDSTTARNLAAQVEFTLAD